MKVESGAVVALAVCIFLSFYFSFLSFQSDNDAFKKQPVNLTATRAGVTWRDLSLRLAIRD